MKKHNIGFTASTFDLFHAGHILMLREAKDQCEYLICGLQVDPSVDRPTKNKPIQTFTERYIQLAACKYVDEIVPYVREQDLAEILKAYPINVRILGEEYRNSDFTGRDICKARDIALYFNKRDHSMSSSGLRARVYAAEMEKAKGQYGPKPIPKPKPGLDLSSLDPYKQEPNDPCKPIGSAEYVITNSTYSSIASQK